MTSSIGFMYRIDVGSSKNQWYYLGLERNPVLKSILVVEGNPRIVAIIGDEIVFLFGGHFPESLPESLSQVCENLRRERGEML